MKKLTKMVNLIWRSISINPDDAWIWYEVFKTLHTQMGGDLRIELAQLDRREFNSLG
jgi:hypothetical protein